MHKCCGVWCSDIQFRFHKSLLIEVRVTRERATCKFASPHAVGNLMF
jgi:hypothetical protein